MSTMAELGPALWLELHLTALRHDLGHLPDQDFKAWLFESWIPKVPEKECRCWSHFVDWYSTNVAPQEEFFEWTVEAHNAVNWRLNKPLWSRDQAWAYYFASLP